MSLPKPMEEEISEQKISTYEQDILRIRIISIESLMKSACISVPSHQERSIRCGDLILLNTTHENDYLLMIGNVCPMESTPIQDMS
jgi:hypothetical protein